MLENAIFLRESTHPHTQYIIAMEYINWRITMTKLAILIKKQIHYLFQSLFLVIFFRRCRPKKDYLNDNDIWNWKNSLLIKVILIKWATDTVSL